jgi:hypothetical protein
VCEVLGCMLAFFSCAFWRSALRYSVVRYYLTLSRPALTEVEQRRDWHCVQSHIQQPKHGIMRCEIAGQELGIQLTSLAVCFFLCVSATQAESSRDWIEWNVVCGYWTRWRGGEVSALALAGCGMLGFVWVFLAGIRMGVSCWSSYEYVRPSV